MESVPGECLHGENDAEVGTVGTVGTARILYSIYYTSLINNDCNILEEKTRGVPPVPTVPTFSDQIAEDEWWDYLRPIVQK
ncbi:MAG: hypothetical protein MR017_03255 [Paraprevotella sp.]|nr:hypothetical protein [Paraprevotella sp.]